MALNYAYFCDDCGASFRQPLDTCLKCGSTEITHAPSCATVEHDDARDAQRLAAIKLQWDRHYAATDFFAAARDLVSADVDTLEVPALRMTMRQAS